MDVKANQTTKMDLHDYGQEPFVCNLEAATKENSRYRTTLWTGEHFQLTLMAIPAGGGDIGMEIHPHVDQFLRMEDGVGKVEMGKVKGEITISKIVHDGDCIIIPANTYHNVTNIGDKPMKLYSIYSPINHPAGTNESTKADAIKQEGPLM